MSTNNTEYMGSKLVLLNGVPMTLPVAASDPGSAVAGDFYYNTTSNTPRYYNGSAWEPVGSGSVTSVAASVPSFLSISGSPITSSGTLAISYSGTALPIANGGTGATSAASAFNNLSPMTTTGDTIYEASAGVAARLAIGSSGQVLTVSGGIPSWATPSSSSITFTDASTVPIYSVSGSPGNSISITLTTETANTVFAGPSSGSAAQPTFRSLVSADIPDLSATYELVSNFAVRKYFNSLALAASQVSPANVPSLSFAVATYGSLEIKYVIIESTTLSRRQGTMRIASDGTNTGYSDEYAQSAVLGVSPGILLGATISGSNIVVQYSGTDANACTMRCEVTLMPA